jgi:GH15 family glucan-1,4-alpha-glucosidase
LVRTLDKTHTVLSYVEGSLKNAIIANGDGRSHNGFIFSLLNPPVPLGGNVVSLDVYVDEIPIPKKSVFIATSEDIINASSLSEDRPISFKPFQSARFLILKDEVLEKRRHKIVILSKLEGFEQIIIPFTFTDYVSEQSERVFITSSDLAEDSPDSVVTSADEDTIFKNFTTPLILSGKKAYIVCSSSGSLSANWTWMGARYDNGGLYVPPARAFGRISVEISTDEGIRKRLPSFVISSKHENGILYTRHELAGLQVRRTLFVPADSKGFVMIINLSDRRFDISKLSTRRNKNRSGREQPNKRRIRVHFLVDGNITSYGLAAISQSNSSKFLISENCLQIETASRKGIAHYYGTIGVAPKELRPVKVLTDSFDNDMEMSYDIEIAPGEGNNLALIASGSFSSSEDCLKEYRYMRDNYESLYETTKSHFFTSSRSKLRAEPDSDRRQNLVVTKLVRAFEKAKTSMEYLKARYDELGDGICAGLPRFPNYWARDTGWALRGYLSMGDYEFALAVIENFLRHQARRTSDNALKGELPMIISGRAFLHNTTFGSSDSTFLFPWAIREYVLATGDSSYLKKRWSSIVDLVNWGFLKDSDGDGLVEHGFTGVAEKLPIQDSTWMDHIDRRKSANDVQALFFESLSIGSELAGIVGDETNQKKWQESAKNLQKKIDLEYWNPEKEYYYDTIRRDGTKDPSIRPNALVLGLTGSVKDPSKAISVLSRLEQGDITTSWGVRTLSSTDPKYHPSLYHDGAVWPLVTGWAAVAEIKHKRLEQALYYLESMAQRILHENGMFAETYRGDRPEPFNSCILQAWSVGMYVYAFRELMLGMKINMIDNKIQLEPQIPESLLSVCSPIHFEYKISAKRYAGILSMIIEPEEKRIGITFRDSSSNRRPEVFSNTYSVS